MKRLLKLRYIGLLPVVFWAVVLGISLAYNLAAIDRHLRELTLTQGRDVFHMIVAMRQWNAKHGGVYVFQSPESPPNPYLRTPKRDLEIRNGEKLTLINPAYMVRQLSESILEEANIRVRISSMNPINPANFPEPWEQDALRAFEQGAKERVEMRLQGELQTLRYMAPLITEQNCLECHGAQGYKVGQIRGGISVSLNSEPIMRSLAPQKQNLYLSHGVAWIILSLLGVFALKRIRQLMDHLDNARQEQESLVEQRTAELRDEVSERRRAERRLYHLMDSSAQGILGVDRAGRVTFCNRHAQELLAGLLSQPEILGCSVAEMFAANPKFSDDLELAMHGTQAEGRLQLKNPDTGAETSLEYLLNAIQHDSQINGCVITLSDITLRQQQEREIWHQAHFDPLTALPNRAMFSSRMSNFLHSGHALGHAAVLFVDLDEFKPVNDRYGHEAGDTVLIEVARRLQAEIRESDFAARIGGDEFVVVLGGAGTSEHAAKVAEKLIEALSLPIVLRSGDQATVTASIGIAIYPKDGENIESLLRNADLAMYQAKEKQRGSYGFYQAKSDHPETTPPPDDDTL